MTLTELCDLYERHVGERGAECPVCSGNMTEYLGRGKWGCWVCRHQFKEGLAITRSQVERIARGVLA